MQNYHLSILVSAEGNIPLGHHCHTFAPIVAVCGVQVHATSTIWIYSELSDSLAAIFKVFSKVIKTIQMFPFTTMVVLTIMCCLWARLPTPSLSTYNSTTSSPQWKRNMSKKLAVFLVFVVKCFLCVQIPFNLLKFLMQLSSFIYGGYVSNPQ